MAVGHIDFNHNTSHGAMLAAALEKLEDGVRELNEIRDTMTQMIDGDGSQATHFAYATPKFGFVDNAGAKAGYDEISSLLGKLNTDGSVTFVNAALKQAFNKLR